MNDATAGVTVPAPDSGARPGWRSDIVRRASRAVPFFLVAAFAFGLYWLSSYILEKRYATNVFGADAYLYMWLAESKVHFRIARFHPTTVAMALAWMKVFNPLTVWIAPAYILKAMFALVGAAGVWAAMSAFASLVSRRYVVLFGLIYATSLGVWYFSSIEESKIVTATLSALYIAVYLHLRERWTMRGAVVLTAILLVACLNEVVAGFLIIIPLVDTLMQRGFDWRGGWWIAVHALAGPVALVILEVFVKSIYPAEGTDAEGGSHISMLFYYIFMTDHGLASLYSFLLNWLFFNIAAPTPDALGVYPAWTNYIGYFEPSVANYFYSPATFGLVVLLGVITAAVVLPRFRADGARDPAFSILVPLMAYAIFRGVFFFIFLPAEPMLFSPAVTLAHMIAIGVPFAYSTFPAKRAILAAFALLLVVVNGGFVIGFNADDTWYPSFEWLRH